MDGAMTAQSLEDSLIAILRDMPPFSAPAVWGEPELGQLLYLLADVPWAAHRVDDHLELLKADGGEVVGVKLTNLPALVDALLDCPVLVAALKARAAERGVSLA